MKEYPPIFPLIKKNFLGTLSSEEQRFLDNWIGKSNENEEIFHRLMALFQEQGDVVDFETFDAELAWKKLQRSVVLERKRRANRALLQKTLKIAAVFIGMALVGTIIWVQYDNRTLSNQVIDQNSIVLQLGNGTSKIIKAGEQRTLVDENGVTLGVQNGNRIIYDTTPKSKKTLELNTLIVPYGEKMELQLSDGTVVYLNSGTSITYPVGFLENSPREVSVIGEAFFDVAHDKSRPFKVDLSKISIEVLGTKFNVAAYPEDKVINTVLVEGSVKLKESGSRDGKVDNIIMEPNQLAAWNSETSETEILKVDTDIYTSWINGRLVLKNLPFSAILKKLERHYDVKIQSNYVDLNRQSFTASFDVESIGEVLNSFNEDTPFIYEIKGRSITINQPPIKNSYYMEKQ